MNCKKCFVIVKCLHRYKCFIGRYKIQHNPSPRYKKLTSKSLCENRWTAITASESWLKLLLMTKAISFIKERNWIEVQSSKNLYNDLLTIDFWFYVLWHNPYKHCKVPGRCESFDVRLQLVAGYDAKID